MQTASRFSHLYLIHLAVLYFISTVTCDFFCTVPNEIMYITWCTFFIHAQVSCYSLERHFPRFSCEISISGKFLFSLSLVDPSREMDIFHIVSYQNIMESNYSI